MLFMLSLSFEEVQVIAIIVVVRPRENFTSTYSSLANIYYCKSATGGTFLVKCNVR